MERRSSVRRMWAWGLPLDRSDQVEESAQVVARIKLDHDLAPRAVVHVHAHAGGEDLLYPLRDAVDRSRLRLCAGLGCRSGALPELAHELFDLPYVQIPLDDLLEDPELRFLVRERDG